MADGQISEVEHRFPCDTCGSDLRFDPGDHQLVCDHCGNVQAIESQGPWTGSIKELDFRQAVDQQLSDADIEETRVTTCPNCGAQTEFDPDIHAAECPFCATPVVTDTGLHRHIKPRGLLPFDLDEGEAPLPDVLHIVPGSPSFDETHFRYQSCELVGHIVPGDGYGVFDEFPRLLPRFSPEVGEEPTFDPDGFSHVEDFILRPQHPVDAWAVLGMLADVSAETGIQDHEKWRFLGGPMGGR